MVSFIHDRIGSILHAAVSVTPADAFKQLEQPGVEEAVDGLPAEPVETESGTVGEEMVVVTRELKLNLEGFGMRDAEPLL